MKPTYEELEHRIQMLTHYLQLAQSDIKELCNNQNGFLRVSYPVNKTFYIESDISSMLNSKELKAVKKYNLPTTTITHPYRFTTEWVWRYDEEVKNLLKIGAD